ncbi:hypothetical protein BJX96DRAFT_186416 [Aspergillus floccosus]
MSTAAPRPGDRPVLGDSWVVASSYIPKDERKQSSHSSPDRKRSTATDSMTTSASSMSGPELIMPSIYEAPISEASWVSPMVRKRRTSREPTSQATPKPPATQTQPTLKTPESSDRTKSTRNVPLPLSNLAEKSLRAVINLILLAAIAHLLVLPEMVQQYQTLCAIDALSTLYPSSCIPPVPSAYGALHTKPASPRQNPALSAQTQLESLLSTALQEMQPLAHALRHSESRLRDLQTDLHDRAPAFPHHELDLEFDGCWQATRAATRKFDSLRADIRAAVDNLVVTAPVPAGDDLSVAHDARLSTQMRRREQYLEQLTARMQSKADALDADLARLEDHLDSIAGVLERHSSGSFSSAGGARHPERDGRAGRRWWSVIEGFVPEALSADRSSSRAAASPSIMRVFQHAAAQHRPVADAVRSLSYRLQALQGRRGM